MDRRTFITTTTVGLFSTLLSTSIMAQDLPLGFQDWRPGDPLNKSGPAPLPEITAAVDVIVPADPEIPNDFKGSDYHGDWVLAAYLENVGQYAVALMLNKYSKQAVGKSFFLDCDDAERLAAIRAWVSEREELAPLIKDMLTGLLTISMIGTFEENTEEEWKVLFESMNWYDPQDPTGTFRYPCEGYPDCQQFPVALRKGLRNGD
ncbi:MAG: hypothetical protein P9M14_17780 [Candidatus Alcyoniella australis]|nr:hypothetical protein [Candidatus Alcyoniella australis]